LNVVANTSELRPLCPEDKLLPIAVEINAEEIRSIHSFINLCLSLTDQETGKVAKHNGQISVLLMEHELFTLCLW
jgi:hypothetical protein